MQRLFDRVRYYTERFAGNLQTFFFKVLTMLSFLMIIFYFGYTIYYSVMCYSTPRVFIGCLLLVTMIHLNKSL